MTPIGPIDTFSLPIRQIRQVSPFWEAARKTTGKQSIVLLIVLLNSTQTLFSHLKEGIKLATIHDVLYNVQLHCQSKEQTVHKIWHIMTYGVLINVAECSQVG